MNRIRIGIVGLRFGKHMAEEIATGSGREWLELAGVCDLDAVKAQEIAGQHRVNAFTDLDALLADPGIPAIGLFTGPAGRAALVRKIIRAGKDVITTKPFERDPDAALEVLLEAKQLGRVVHLNSPGPVPPMDITKILQWQDNHQLGRPVAARFETWASYREQADGGWYDDPQLCPVPPIFRLGIYCINDLVALLGEAERVTVLESRLFTGRPTADNGQMGILFKNGALANVFASFCVEDGDCYRDSLVLNFERGTIYRSVGASRPATRCELSLIKLVEGKPQRVEHAELPQRSGDYQWENFCRAVRGEKLEGEVPPEQIVSALRVIEAMTLAANGNGTATI